MKKIIAASALLAAMSTGAFAQATQDVEISATVGKFCTINNAVAGVAVQRSVTVTNGFATAGALSPVTVGSVVCNTNADVTMASISGGITGPANSNASFTNKIHYTATADFGSGTQATIASSGSPAPTTGTSGGAASGDLTVNISVITNTLPAVYDGGTAYSDILRVTLTPQ